MPQISEILGAQLRSGGKDAAEDENHGGAIATIKNVQFSRGTVRSLNLSKNKWPRRKIRESARNIGEDALLFFARINAAHRSANDSSPSIQRTNFDPSDSPIHGFPANPGEREEEAHKGIRRRRARRGARGRVLKTHGVNRTRRHRAGAGRGRGKPSRRPSRRRRLPRTRTLRVRRPRTFCSHIQRARETTVARLRHPIPSLRQGAIAVLVNGVGKVPGGKGAIALPQTNGSVPLSIIHPLRIAGGDKDVGNAGAAWEKAAFRLLGQEVRGIRETLAAVTLQAQ